MTYDEYAALTGVNWSTLKAMKISAKHYQHVLETPSKVTPAFLVGGALHCAVLEPDELDKRYATWTGEDRRTKAGKLAWTEFCEQLPGREVLTLDQRDHVANMAAAVHCHPEAAKVLERAGPCEHVIQWTDKESGIDCKARLDKLTDRVVEVKTAREVEPWTFSGASARYLYHGQLAYYHDGVAALGQQLEPPVIITVENTPPYDVVVYDCTELLEAGRRLYRELLRLAVCRNSGHWPGIASCRVPLEFPRWADDSDEDADWSGVEMRPSSAEGG